MHFTLPISVISRDFLVENGNINFLDQLAEMVFVKDENGIFIYSNQSFSKFLGGCEPKGILGTTDAKFFTKRPDLVKQFKEIDDKVIKSGEATGWYEEECQPDGQEFPVILQVRKMPVTLAPSNLEIEDKSAADTKKRGLLGIFHIVTDERQAFSEVQRLVRMGSLMWHIESNDLYVSDGVYHLLGIKPAGILRRNPSDFFSTLKKHATEETWNAFSSEYDNIRHKDTRARHEDEASYNGTEHAAEFSITTHEGKTLHLRLLYKSYFASSEADPLVKNERRLVTIQDITELEKRRLQLANLNRTQMILGLAEAPLHDAVNALLTAEDACQQIGTTIAIGGNVQNKSAHLLAVAKDCSIAVAEIRSLEVILRTGKIDKEPVSLYAIVEACKAKLHRLVLKNNVEWRVPELTAENSPMLIGNEAALVSALHNLLNNAVNRGCATTPAAIKQWVEIGLKKMPAERKIQIQIRDSGTGFKTEVIQNFSAPGSATVNFQGLGLGLSISAQIALMHDGNLEILPGSGAPCLLTLPISD